MSNAVRQRQLMLRLALGVGVKSGVARRDKARSMGAARSVAVILILYLQVTGRLHAQRGNIEEKIVVDGLFRRRDTMGCRPTQIVRCRYPNRVGNQLQQQTPKTVKETSSQSVPT